MVFQLFRAGYLSSERERVQMNRLIGYLMSTYESRGEDEKCILIIEPQIPEIIGGREIPRHPDALILKDNMFVVVEMKEYRGGIIADCTSGSLWRSTSGEIIQPLGSVNPFEQAKFYRDILIGFLQKRFVDYNSAPRWAKVTSAKVDDWVKEHVVSLVVTDEASRPSVTGFVSRQPSFFDVVSLDKLPQKISFLRASTQLFRPSEINHFIETVGAKPTNAEWYRGLLSELSSFVGLIPKITNWMESEEYEPLSKALKFIKELELKQHVPHIVNVWREKKYTDLRKQCLFLLIEWQFGQIGKVLDEALNDENPQIFHFALDYLSKHGCSETIPTLKRVLTLGSPEIQKGALEAIASSGDKSSCSTIFDFAKQNLFSKPFKDFQFWSERVEKYRNYLAANHAEDKEFVELDHKQASYVDLFCTVINGLGYLDCKESIPWLMEIVNDPMSIGFETNDYGRLNTFFSSYFSIFESACKTLGSLGIGNKKITQLLIGKLANSPEEYQQCIINTLGELGDLDAESALIPFLHDRNHVFFYDATLALSKLKSNKAFGPIAKAYLRNIHDESGQWAEEALAKINPLAFEKILLDQIRSDKNTDEIKNHFLRVLLPIVSHRSADTLFSLLANEELSGNASWVLWKLADNEGIRKRTMLLTHSENPFEKASAISILEDYFKKNLGELQKFEKDAQIEVRRAVVNIYYLAKSRMKLFEFAKDPDKEIRDSVFNSVAFDAVHYSHCFLTSNLAEYGQCEVASGKDYLLFNLSNEVLIMPKQSIQHSQITDNDARIYGIYFESRRNLGLVEEFLIVPIPRHYHFRSSENWSNQIYADLKIPTFEGQTTLNEGDLKALWAKVPPETLKQIKPMNTQNSN